jgi:hypothetical protein
VQVFQLGIAEALPGQVLCKPSAQDIVVFQFSYLVRSHTRLLRTRRRRERVLRAQAIRCCHDKQRVCSIGGDDEASDIDRGIVWQCAAVLDDFSGRVLDEERTSNAGEGAFCVHRLNCHGNTDDWLPCRVRVSSACIIERKEIHVRKRRIPHSKLIDVADEVERGGASVVADSGGHRRIVIHRRSGSLLHIENTIDVDRVRGPELRRPNVVPLAVIDCDVAGNEVARTCTVRPLAVEDHFAVRYRQVPLCVHRADVPLSGQSILRQPHSF